MRHPWRISPHRPPFGPLELNEKSPQAEGLIFWGPTLGSRGANVLRDFGGRGLDGVFPGGAANPSWVGDGRFGSVLSFDGNDDNINLGDHDAFSFGAGTADMPFSVSAWIYPVSEYRMIIAKRDDSTAQREWSLDLAAGRKITLSLHDNSNWVSVRGRRWNTALVASKWCHVTATYDGNGLGGIAIYVDGIRRDDTNVSAGTYVAMENSTASLLLGAYLNAAGEPDWVFDSKITDLRINNVALSPTVIWGMAHDKKWDLYRLVRRVWAMKGKMFNPAWAMRANRLLVEGGVRV